MKEREREDEEKRMEEEEKKKKWRKKEEEKLVNHGKRAESVALRGTTIYAYTAIRPWFSGYSGFILILFCNFFIVEW